MEDFTTLNVQLALGTSARVPNPDDRALRSGDVYQLAVDVDDAMARDSAARARYLAIYGVEWVALQSTPVVVEAQLARAESIASTLRSGRANRPTVRVR